MKTKVNTRKGSHNYWVFAYYPARHAFQPTGYAKEKLIISLAKKSGGITTGSGTELAGKTASRDISFAFKTKANATKFVNLLKARRIRRSSIRDHSKYQ